MQATTILKVDSVLKINKQINQSKAKVLRLLKRLSRCLVTQEDEETKSWKISRRVNSKTIRLLSR